MPTVRVWTGREARALRQALRLSVRAFAEHLGVAVRTVSKWEQLGEATQPRPDTQAILDTALDRSDAAEQRRFHMLVAETSTRTLSRDADQVPDAWDCETWADDLERAVVFLSRQNFLAATILINRWLTRFAPERLDAKGLYLHARSLVLIGDAQRDQGVLVGPLSAPRSYRRALGMFGELDIPRRIAQIELSLAVVTEMTGNLQSAAHRYDDWSMAQQKLALAYRGGGDLGQALHFIDIALASDAKDTPMQRVRLSTAHAHILLSDRATCENGLALLDQTAQLALTSGLSHQLHSIQTIRQGFEHSDGRSI